MIAEVKHNRSTVGVIDIFAGPGGLGEGFSSFETVPGSGLRPYRIRVSAEMERAAHSTLRLRAFYRLLSEREGDLPNVYLKFLIDWSAGLVADPGTYFSSKGFGEQWQQAEAEALNLTLGVPDHDRVLYERIGIAKRQHDRLVLIGGPPMPSIFLGGARASEECCGIFYR